MPLQLDDLAALDAPAPNAGLPLLLAVDAIDEDPEQPRHEFDANALEELAQTIRERGVRQPISVRPDLQRAGRWILNFGARRLRAARLAGLAQIPAFVDTTADDYDQVIENEQREGLRPLELAMFVQKRLARGDSQTEIARRLGKSRQWVTLATALIEPPDWLLQAYREGRCRGMNELYELRRLHGQHAADVEAWATHEGAMTRDRIAALRRDLMGGPVISGVPETAGSTSAATLHTAEGRQRDARIEQPQPAPGATRAEKRIHVEFDGQDYQLVVSVAPEQPGCMYVRPLAGGPRRLASVSQLKLLGFAGG